MQRIKMYDNKGSPCLRPLEGVIFPFGGIIYQYGVRYRRYTLYNSINPFRMKSKFSKKYFNEVLLKSIIRIFHVMLDYHLS